MDGVIRPFHIWAVSSAVERLVYTERVGGSKPSPPNSQRSEVRGQRSAIRGLFQQIERDWENNFLPLGVFFGGWMQTVGADE